MASSHNARLSALGDELVAIHQWLRDELALIRDRAASGQRAPTSERPLAAHCLAFCESLTRHHTSEDGRAFPALAQEYPELGPTIDKLEEDHAMISGIVLNVENLVARLSEEPEPAETRRLVGELDGLTAILDSHFAFEERRIATALSALGPSASSVEFFGLEPPPS